MTKEQLFDAIGEAKETYVRDAHVQEGKKTPWLKWCALAACVVLVVGTVLWRVLPAGPIVEDPAPSVEWEGRTYFASAWPATHSKLPEGCVYMGKVNDEVQGECDLYADPSDPLRVYVHMRVHQSTGESRMGYLRYVDEDLRGNHFIRYNGQLYINIGHAEYWGEEPDVTKEAWEAVKETYGYAVKDTPPAGFVEVGTTTFSGYDTVPMEELSSNERVTAVLANPDVPEVILTPYTWYGKGGTRIDEHLVFIRYTGPLS